jgi:hypothetical protein
VTEAGVDDVETRVASDSTGGSFYVEMGGVDATGPIWVAP